MNRPARLLAATTTILMIVGVGFAGPSDAARATATKTTVTVGTSVAGHRTTLAATVRPNPGSGTVRFTANGRTISGCTRTTLRSGRAACSTTFGTAGSRSVTAAYSSSRATYRSSTGRVTVRTVAAPVAAKPTTVIGGTGSCTASSGALVAVSYKPWGGPIVRGCATSLSSGRALLTSAHFGIDGVSRFPSFVCRLGTLLYDHGARYPKPTQDRCVNTPPTAAYWSFWTAAKGANTWTYSPHSAAGDKPANGEVETWTFGRADINAGTGKPAYAPNQLRAGLAATARTAARHAQVQLAAAGSTPNLSAGANYLISHLVGGNHYETSGQPDLQLTLDSTLALIALGTRDDTVGAMSDYLATHQNEYTFLSGQHAAYASGGAVGKTALLAETAGRNPRSFGGADLIKGLRNLTCTSTNTRCAGPGNYAYTSTTFGQALAVLAQIRAGDASGAQGPTRYLEGLQLASGGFTSSIPAGRAAAETDSTALAAMALALVPGTTARTALGKSLSWLAKQQSPDGGFPGASGNSVNSAALSIQALRLDDETYSPRIAKGERFLASMQNGDGGFDVAAAQPGSDLRASAQGLGGAVGTPFGSLLDNLPAKGTASAGADYLVGQLVNGDHYTSSYVDDKGNTVTYDDQGLTADGVFALLAAGKHPRDVDAMVAYLAGQAATYSGANDPTYGPASGAAAKLAVVAYAAGKNPDDFGGVDLLKILTEHVCTKASPDAYGPCTAPGDFANAFSEISQALGVLALQAAPAATDHLNFGSAPVVRLRQLQCDDGGFTSTLIKSGDKCTSEADATGYAVQALASVPGADAVLGKAQHYLENVQKKSGLFAGAAGDNANSTALAADGLQTLVTALYSATVDSSGPKTITPITHWQSALTGLVGLSVPSGGFGLTSNRSADLRASTQAVLAAAQRTLLSLAGARVASAPRDAAVPSPGTPGGPSTGSGSSAPVSPGANGSATPLGAGRPADTGVRTGQLLGWALLLVVLGVALAFAGRRRIAVVIGRHRAGGHVH